MPNYTILIIDYEPRSIERMRVPLERAGYQVEVAKDGESGIRRFHALKPSAVIIEAMLPKRHGFEVCKELKQAPHGTLCPVMIATSVYRGRKYRHQATHLYQCDEYLEKPIGDEDLLQIIKGALEKYAERRRIDAAETAAETAAENASEMEIDRSLLAAEPNPDLDQPRAQAKPPKKPAEAVDDSEFDIIDRLDALLSDDPSKSSPSGSG